jgi:SnoaL-like domain
MSDIPGTVGRYMALWNEGDDMVRAQSIADMFTADATYTDPMADVSGHDGISAVMTGARSQFAGCVFNLLAPADTNHHVARFSWELVPATGGESIVIGSDVATFAEDGKIRSIIGFLDKVPAA